MVDEPMPRDASIDWSEGTFAMIAQFTDSVAGTPVYLNPAYVVSMRPDPAEPNNVTIVKLRDGESIRVRGHHETIADKLAETV